MSRGKATMIEPTARSAYVRTVLITGMHSPLDESELHERERHDQEEQDHRLRAGVAELEVLKGVLIDAVDENARGIHRSASCEQVDLREGLEHRDRVDDEQEEQRRRHHWDGDAGEHPEPARAVDTGGLVDLLGHSLQSREQHDDVRAQGQPDRGDRDSDDRGGRLDQPLGSADADERRMYSAARGSG